MKAKQESNDMYQYFLRDKCAYCGKKVTDQMMNFQKVLKLELNHSISKFKDYDLVWSFKFCNEECFKKGMAILMKEMWLE